MSDQVRQMEDAERRGALAASTVKALAAQNRRYRAALEQIAGAEWTWAGSEAARAAREAL